MNKVTVFLCFEGPHAIEVRMPSPPGGPLVDFQQTIGPGQSFAGYSYDELRTLGQGRHELDERPESKAR